MSLARSIALNSNPTASYSFEWKALLHVLLGLVGALNPQLVPLWVLYVIFYEGTYKVYKTKNIAGQAHLAAAYMAAMEMIVRMSRSGLPHELTKYAVIFILINGLFAQVYRPKGIGPILIYFILLLPSTLFLVYWDSFDYARQMASFNLSGPLCLTVSTFYFFRRTIKEGELIRIFQQILLPLISTLSWLFVRTPNISEINFEFGANFAASGYGPNQMASGLGLGVLIIGISFLMKWPLSKWRPFAFLLLAALTYRGLLTFSRGGIFAPVVILLIISIYLSFSKISSLKSIIRFVFVTGLLTLVGYGIFTYVDKLTEGALLNRYIGISHGEKVDASKYTSGRLDILLIDSKIFLDNPILGIGPGVGTVKRFEYGYHDMVAAHIEFSRLPAEHGIFGLIALTILIYFPFKEFKRRKQFEQRVILIAGVLFCFLFMAHSATRIALPMFMYGLGFIILDTGHQNTYSII
ncbi:MAG: O-antigen ligase family protein [Thermaurantimonas sp.]|uniref:O-antigen ligase family protein n=1 Tax=Thermaurantimonas sp. TaxID=2681568 RepID=UPI00391CBF2F